MPARTGSDTHLGVTLSSAFNTVIAAGSGQKLQVDGITHGKALTEITENAIGSGLSMQQDSQTGDFNPTMSLPKTVRDLDQGNALIAAFMGREVVNAGANSSFTHSFIHQAASITNFVNVAFTPDSANCIEYVNGVVTRLQFDMNPNDYLKQTADLLFTNQLITGTTNTAASLASASEVSGRKPFVVRPEHYVRINAQAGGALANGDKVAVTNCTVVLSKERALTGEIRGEAGYGAPTSSGGSAAFVAEVTLTFKTLEDMTYYTAVNAGTEYKMDMLVDGELIGGSTYRRFVIRIPRAKIVTDPQFNVANAGNNELTVTFRSLVASSTPPEMYDVYPQLMSVNTRSTAYWQ
jgi:hypothetical protein